MNIKKVSDEFVGTHEAAELIGVSPRTMEVWRQKKYGPPFYKITSRKVVYSIHDLYEWKTNRKVSFE